MMILVSSKVPAKQKDVAFILVMPSEAADQV